jgi:hypothetical protein
MTIKLFVGCAANGEDAESLAVLEHSVRKNTKADVDITWMKVNHDSESPWGGWNMTTWATPFSGFRWAIPEACNFEGQAIYCDSDFIFLSDLQELWDQPFEKGKVVMAKGGEDSWRYCCAKWDCSKAGQYLLPLSRMKNIPQAHQRMMAFFSQNRQVVQSFEGNWNCIDGEDLTLDKIDALHYSDMSSQFHLKYAIPRLEAEGKKHWFDGKIREHWRKDLQEIFDEYLTEAIAAGFTLEKYIPGNNAAFGEYNKQSQKYYGNAHKWSK